MPVQFGKKQTKFSATRRNSSTKKRSKNLSTNFSGLLNKSTFPFLKAKLMVLCYNGLISFFNIGEGNLVSD